MITRNNRKNPDRGGGRPAGQVARRSIEQSVKAMNRHERRAKKAQDKARILMVKRGTVPPRDGPRPTLQEFLDEWIEKGREIFAKEQKIDPAFIGWLPDNSQIILTVARFGDKKEQQAFNAGSIDILLEENAVMMLRVGEAWVSQKLQKASKASDRREVVIFKAGDLGDDDHDTDQIALLEINRDWESGKATLGEPEFATDWQSKAAHI